ncbi:MAG: hypothetical protein ABSE70_01910 [Candidatus Limnocylindrales bacterium]
MIFRCAAIILDVWLAAVRMLTSPRRTWRSMRRAPPALPGDRFGAAARRADGEMAARRDDGSSRPFPATMLRD